MAKLATLPPKLVCVYVHTTAQIGIKGDIKVGDWWANVGEARTDLTCLSL